MGTRNLTMVIDKEGKTKIAQYGQWDGYPGGQGSTALDFLKNNDLEKFQEKLKNVRFSEKDGKDKEWFDAYNKNAPEWSSDPDNRTPEQIEWFSSFITRNLGAEILKNIAESAKSEIILNDHSSFVSDSLFCEWAYVIDFSKNTFEVYTGFNQSPLTDDERFKDFPKDGEYYPIKHVKTYQLDNLPLEEDFIKECDSQEEEEDE